MKNLVLSAFTIMLLVIGNLSLSAQKQEPKKESDKKEHSCCEKSEHKCCEKCEGKCNEKRDCKCHKKCKKKCKRTQACKDKDSKKEDDKK